MPGGFEDEVQRRVKTSGGSSIRARYWAGMDSQDLGAMPWDVLGDVANGTGKNWQTFEQRSGSRRVGIDGSSQRPAPMQESEPASTNSSDLTAFAVLGFALCREGSRGRRPQQHEVPRHFLPQPHWPAWLSAPCATGVSPTPNVHANADITKYATHLALDRCRRRIIGGAEGTSAVLVGREESGRETSLS